MKSLVAFPQVLEPMNDKLDWTQKLGDAFLAQQKDVLAAVQRLRAQGPGVGQPQDHRAAEGRSSTDIDDDGPGQQTIIRIEPANPQVIYVPAYDPTVVYGAWGYPAYPPYYWPPYPAYYPGLCLRRGFAWGIGFAAAGAIFGNCNWGGGDVDIDVNEATNIDRNFDRNKARAASGSMTPAIAKAWPTATTPRARSSARATSPAPIGATTSAATTAAGRSRRHVGDRGRVGDRGGRRRSRAGVGGVGRRWAAIAAVPAIAARRSGALGGEAVVAARQRLQRRESRWRRGAAQLRPRPWQHAAARGGSRAGGAAAAAAAARRRQAR